MKENHVNEAEIPICVENFDALAKKYRPVILSNIKRVHKMYQSSPQIEFDDLYQEGLWALWEAIKNFKKEKGVYFGVYLKVAVGNRMKCLCRNYLPHRYIKDPEKSTPEKAAFKRMPIQVGTLDDVKSYLL